MTDLDIIKRVRAGNVNAYAELVRKYERRVFGLAMRWLKNEQDALDVTQTVFLKAYLYLGNYRSEAGYFTYLYRVTVNTCKDALAARSRRREMNGELVDRPDPAPSPEQQAETNEMLSALSEAIMALPDPFKEAMILRSAYGFSYDEIAEMTKADLGTVKSRLSRAREKVRDAMRQKGFLSGESHA